MQHQPGGPQGYHQAHPPQHAGGWGGGHGGGYGQAHFPPVHLEFSPADDATLQKVSDRTRRWGLTALVGGGLLLLMGIGGVVATSTLDVPAEIAPYLLGAMLAGVLPLGLTNVAVGVFYMRTAESIGAIAGTQGHDLPHLMDALQKLRVAFQIEVVVGLLAFVGGFVASIALAASS